MILEFVIGQREERASIVRYGSSELILEAVLVKALRLFLRHTTV